MKSTILIIILLYCMIILKSDAIKTPILINCGLKSGQSISSSDNRVWRSDDDPAFAPQDINDVSTTFTNTTTTTDDDNDQLGPLLNTARLFWSPVTYTFSISPAGPIFLRLYFSTTLSFNNTLPYQFSTSLVANNNLTLLRNFNPFLNSIDLHYEFQLILQNGTNNLNLTFSPGDILNYDNNNSNLSSNNNKVSVPVPYGYVNGIEIRAVPEDLYIDVTKRYTWVTNPTTGYFFNRTTASSQTAYRLNVGGKDVARSDDNSSSTGGMMRKWYADESYLVGSYYGEVSPGYISITYNNASAPSYVAPKIVYGTTRHMGFNPAAFNLARNLTWGFKVDPGFEYLVRLHLCELDGAVTGSSQKMFSVYIDGQLAESDLDIWALTGGLYIPMYKDYVISVYPSGGGGVSNGSKVDLLLALHPVNDSDTDASLNGLEILKLSTIGNLAVPNPPYNPPSPATSTTGQSSTRHKTRIIIGSVVGAVLLLLLVVCVLLALYRRRAKNKTLFTTAKSSSKGQWLPASIESQSSAATTNTNSSRPSLPSNLCRCFSLSQIRVATCDFDENSIIGTGGFGKVYKGSIDDGATIVAIKRLNPLSKQGAHEFVTEIEMLSRLRHVHLVSLIGYCEEQGEMILVYEYMSHGTLRDQLNYKKKNNNNNNDDTSTNTNSVTITTLSWKQRLMICLGSARGLHYLHTSAKQVIIHRDVKSTNILLDEKWTAKVSDFGLSKVGPDSDDTGVGHVSTAVKGSIGYLDPEYYRRHQLTEKSDVYSFGVVLFEVLCGRPAVVANISKEQVNLAYWGRNCYNKGTLHTIVDPNLSGQIAPECLKKFGEVAEMCVRDHGDERPSMGDVVWSLQFALDLQQTAENNNNTTGGGPMVEVLAVSSDGGRSADKDTFTSTSGDDDTKRLIGRSNFSVLTSSTNDTSTTNYGMGMNSASVFSEILDPRAR